MKVALTIAGLVLPFLMGANPPRPTASASAAPGTAIVQENLVFLPGEVTVRKGTRLSFPNRDGVFHSVYCASGSQTFDLGLHATGPGPSVLIAATGDLEIRCRVHRRMRATVHVTP
ncbi:MAG: hypothetical protein VKP57_08315 [Candidatus Sericytochromatia bacterium]|nr:hypothetical protein [Candidatus Sericytochromatia bacterium]